MAIAHPRKNPAQVRPHRLGPGRRSRPQANRQRRVDGGECQHSCSEKGYSNALNLLIRWDHGQLGWHDLETGQHIVRYEDLEARADIEREAGMAAEARVGELEAELERRRQD